MWGLSKGWLRVCETSPWWTPALWLRRELHFLWVIWESWCNSGNEIWFCSDVPRLNSSLTNATTRRWKWHSNLDGLMLPRGHTRPRQNDLCSGMWAWASSPLECNYCPETSWPIGRWSFHCSLGSLCGGLTGWKETWRFMNSPALLLVCLPSPAANCPTRDQGSDPVLCRPCIPHKHPPPALSSPPSVADH